MKYWTYLFVLQSFSSMDWDFSTWDLVMMSLSIMQPKSDFPGSANQRATRLMPSFVTHRPHLMPRTRKMASYTSRTDSSVWLIIRSSPLYSEGSSVVPELPKKFSSIASSQIRFQTNTFVCLFFKTLTRGFRLYCRENVPLRQF